MTVRPKLPASILAVILLLTACRSLPPTTSDRENLYEGHIHISIEGRQATCSWIGTVAGRKYFWISGLGNLTETHEFRIALAPDPIELEAHEVRDELVRAIQAVEPIGDGYRTLQPHGDWTRFERRFLATHGPGLSFGVQWSSSDRPEAERHSILVLHRRFGAKTWVAVSLPHDGFGPR